MSKLFIISTFKLNTLLKVLLLHGKNGVLFLGKTSAAAMNCDLLGMLKTDFSPSLPGTHIKFHPDVPRGLMLHPVLVVVGGSIKAVSLG